MSHWFYGRRSVSEILLSNVKVEKILLARGVDADLALTVAKLAESKRVPLHWVSRQDLDLIAPGNHQGVALAAAPPAWTDFKTFCQNLKKNSRSFVCLLDEIQDPQNLGAVIRSAVCFGCSGLILPSRRSAKVTGAVMKSSSGALAHLPVVEVSNLSFAIERLKESGFWILGAEVESKELVTQAKIDFPCALVLGNEHRGIKPVLKKSCDRLVSIPQDKRVASLNVSNAAAIFFYEIFKQLR